jgi:hypothetical protein
LYNYETPATHIVTMTATVDGKQCVPAQDDVTVDPDAGPGTGTAESQTCLVPDLIGEQRNAAQGIWDAEGFSTEVLVVASASSNEANWDIEFQSITADQEVPCESVIQIGPNVLGGS